MWERGTVFGAASLAGLIAGRQRDLSAAADLMHRALDNDPENTALLRHTFTLVAADGADLPNGCSIGFSVLDDRPHITIDSARAEAAGMELDAALLQLATVIND